MKKVIILTAGFGDGHIHAQGGLAVAAHPHLMKSEWAKDTLYLWENQEKFAPVIDAWEIANRNNLFTPVSQRRLPFIANSDFHKPKHVYSWKTVLHCEKKVEAIKECIRRNEHVSITLYRGELAVIGAEAVAAGRHRQSNLALDFPELASNRLKEVFPTLAQHGSGAAVPAIGS